MTTFRAQRTDGQDPMKNTHRINGLIYITSEEVINKNDYITDGYKVWKWKDDSSLLGRLKVILSNDQTLTSNGIQAIESDAVKWLNENQSCEEVEIDNRPKISSFEKGFVMGNPNYNKIIIPKEEKCTCKTGEPYNNACCKIHGSIPKEESKQECKGSFKDCFKPLNECVCDTINKEILEERKPYWDLVDRKAEQNNTIDLNSYANGVEDGAKWQQEQDKNKYSEEDMNEYADYVLMCSAEKTFKLPLPPKEWFEQYKK